MTHTTYGRGLARKRIGDKRGACEDWMIQVTILFSALTRMFPKPTFAP